MDLLGSRTRRSAQLAADVLHGIADGLDLLGILVGDVDLELVLELHDQLDGVHRVGAEIVDEARLGGDLVASRSELLADDVVDAFLDVVSLRHVSLPRTDLGRFWVRAGSSPGRGEEVRTEACKRSYMVMPPSTTRVCPVTYAAASLHKNATVPAMSFGAPKRPSGICFSMASRTSPVSAAVMSVSTKPGATTLTVT